MRAPSALIHGAASGSKHWRLLVTKTYPLDDINLGYEDMRTGHNLRGVLTYN